MNLYEMLERVKEYDSQKMRTRILRDLNQQLVNFSRKTKLLTSRCDLFTQSLTDNDGWELITEKGETLESSRYGSSFPLPSECYDLIALTSSDDDLEYSLDHGVLTFARSGRSVSFTGDTTTSVTLDYNKRPALLKEDHDEPEFHRDFHEGPLWMLLARYAAVKQDKLFEYFIAQAQMVLDEAKVYATKLGRQSYDVKPFDWST